MPYDLARIEERHRIVLDVSHVGETTTIRADLTLHLSPSVIDPDGRVSVIDLDLRWVHAASVPDMAEELARVLDRIATGLRQGPTRMLKLITTPVPPSTPKEPTR